MKKALVCGAGGFIGGHLVKYLKTLIKRQNMKKRNNVLSYNTFKKNKKMYAKFFKILEKLSLKYHWEDTDEIIRHKVIRGEW